MAYDPYYASKIITGQFSDPRLSNLGKDLSSSWAKYQANLAREKERQRLEQERKKAAAKQQAFATSVSNAMQGDDVNLGQIGKDIAGTDPAKALDLYSKQQEIDLKRDQLAGKSTRTPEAVRTKLVSNLNALNARIARSESNDPSLRGMQELANSISEQIAADLPSIQAAYSLFAASEKVLGGKPKEVYEEVDEGVTDLPSGVSVVNGEAIRNNKVSSTPTDWYSMETVNGALKPVLHDGLNDQNLPDNVESKFDKAFSYWAKTNAAAKNAAAKNAAAKNGEKIASNFAKGISVTVKKLGSIATQLRSLIDKFNKEDYNLANFADLKNTMADGRMTDSDVGLALGLSTSEGVLQNLKNIITGGIGGVGELDDKAKARGAINRTIDYYNKTMSNMLNPNFSGTYGEQAKKAWEDQSYSTSFSSLPVSFPKIADGSSKGTASLVNFGNKKVTKELTDREKFFRRVKGIRK